MEKMQVSFILNGQPLIADFLPGQTLMEYLRKIGIVSVKHGCDHGECGACTVLIDNKAYNSCLILLHTLQGKTVLTSEGLGNVSNLHPLQQSFVEHGAIQCGYCTPGMVLSAHALLLQNPNPTQEEIKDALAGNLCRCTGYVKPIESVQEAKGAKP